MPDSLRLARLVLRTPVSRLSEEGELVAVVGYGRESSDWGWYCQEPNNLEPAGLEEEVEDIP